MQGSCNPDVTVRKVLSWVLQQLHLQEQGLAARRLQRKHTATSDAAVELLLLGRAHSSRDSTAGLLPRTKHILTHLTQCWHGRRESTQHGVRRPGHRCCSRGRRCRHAAVTGGSPLAALSSHSLKMKGRCLLTPYNKILSAPGSIQLPAHDAPPPTPTGTPGPRSTTASAVTHCCRRRHRRHEHRHAVQAPSSLHLPVATRRIRRCTLCPPSSSRSTSAATARRPGASSCIASALQQVRRQHGVWDTRMLPAARGLSFPAPL